MFPARARSIAQVMLLAAVAAGCTGTPTRMGIPWWSQGPGDVEEAERADGEPRRNGEPAAATAAAVPGAAAETPAPVTPPQPAEAPVAPAQAAPAPAAPAPEVQAPAVSPGGAAYTQASRYGDLLFLSGQIAIDRRTGAFDPTSPIEEQTRVVMENIRDILAEHRLTMANVVSVTVYLTELRELPHMNAVYERYFRGTLPARSVVEVSGLPRGARVEISVVAGR